jgi:hypothetical protein
MRSKKLLGRLLVLPPLIALALQPTATASVAPALSFEAIVQSAGTIFRGRVLRIQSRWEDTTSGRAIVTGVTFRVERLLKGFSQPEVTLDFLGGEVGDVALDVVGVPRFSIDQRDIICAYPNGSYVSPVVGFNQGRFRVTHDAVRNQDFVTASDGSPISTVADVGRPRPLVSQIPVPSLSLESFESEILKVVYRAR